MATTTVLELNRHTCGTSTPPRCLQSSSNSDPLLVVPHPPNYLGIFQIRVLRQQTRAHRLEYSEDRHPLSYTACISSVSWPSEPSRQRDNGCLVALCIQRFGVSNRRTLWTFRWVLIMLCFYPSAKGTRSYNPVIATYPPGLTAR